MPLVAWAKISLMQYHATAHTLPAFSRSFSFAAPSVRQHTGARHCVPGTWTQAQSCRHGYTSQAAAPAPPAGHLTLRSALFVAAIGASASALYLAGKAGQYPQHTPTLLAPPVAVACLGLPAMSAVKLLCSIITACSAS